jgi:hypothetical protein
MRKPSLLALIAVWSTAPWACGRDSLGPVRGERGVAAISAAHSLEGGGIVVDDDRVNCPDADFTTIQAAVAAAAPGDRIVVCQGTYHEQVTVSTNDLRILAQEKLGVVVNAHGHEFGFLVLNASGVTIEGFRVEHAHEADIALGGATSTTIRHNLTTAAGHDGIALFASHDNLIEHNVVVDNLAANACGINVMGGSTRNVVRENRLVNNEWGIQIAGATTLDNVISENTSFRNRGNGIRNVGGAAGTIIEENRAFGNGFAPSALTTGTTGAGIRIGGGMGIVVRENRAFGNRLVDLRNDAGTGATFEENHCRTSSPPGLCEPDEDDD